MGRHLAAATVLTGAGLWIAAPAVHAEPAGAVALEPATRTSDSGDVSILTSRPCPEQATNIVVQIVGGMVSTPPPDEGYVYVTAAEEPAPQLDGTAAGTPAEPQAADLGPVGSLPAAQDATSAQEKAPEGEQEPARVTDVASSSAAPAGGTSRTPLLVGTAIVAPSLAVGAAAYARARRPVPDRPPN